jgi:hypothetical protein
MAEFCTLWDAVPDAQVMPHSHSADIRILTRTSGANRFQPPSSALRCRRRLAY